MGTESIDILWVVMATILVFTMQAGFMCLESGLTRSKNSINVAVKNLSDISLSLVIFWLWGGTFMFGSSVGGWIGLEPLDLEPSSSMVFWLFQAMFCGTAVTIVSGAVAERMRFGVYLFMSFILSGFTYTIFGHWVWGGLAGSQPGWLENLGFVDFAGSTVVHATGAWVALALLLIIGPRRGRYSEDGSAQPIQGSNMPFSFLGVLLIWVGWFGFNGGSQLAFDDAVPRILVNTFIAGCVGLLACLVLDLIHGDKVKAESLMIGSLAGLVSITACCHAITPHEAMIVGFGGGWLAHRSNSILEKWRIDDAVGAIPVHGVAGVWGTLCVAFFGDLDGSLDRYSWIGIQALGVVVHFVFIFSSTYLIFSWLNRRMNLRVSESQEAIGLNISEHGAITESSELIRQMQSHQDEGDFDQPVDASEHTEVGVIAAQYNRVLASFVAEKRSLEEEREASNLARDDALRAREELSGVVEKLNGFNALAIEREKRMVELKGEVNRLARELQRDVPYPEHDEL